MKTITAFLSYVKSIFTRKAETLWLPRSMTSFIPCLEYGKSYSAASQYAQMDQKQISLRHRSCSACKRLNYLRSFFLLRQCWKKHTPNNYRLHKIHLYMMKERTWRPCISSFEKKIRMIFTAYPLKKSRKWENSPDFFSSSIYTAFIPA